MGFFRTFPQIQKSAGMGPHSGSELLPESSSSTRRAHAVPMDSEEDESVTESESEVRTATSGWMRLGVSG